MTSFFSHDEDIINPLGFFSFLIFVDSPAFLGLGHTCWEKRVSKEEGDFGFFGFGLLNGEGLGRLETCCFPN